MIQYDVMVETTTRKEKFVISADSTQGAVSHGRFAAFHEGWARDPEDIVSVEARPHRRENMADQIKTVGDREKETQRAVRYQTTWGVVYIPKLQLEKIGNPDAIEVTVKPMSEDD